MFGSFGLYIFVWSYEMRRSIETLIEQPDQPIWKSVALLVPIFNLFLLFELGKKIQGVQWRADPQKVNGALPWIGICFFVATVTSKLYGHVADLGILAFALIALMHQDFSRAQIALLGDQGAPTRLNWIEWIVIVVGCGLVALGVTSIILEPPSNHYDAVERVWVGVSALAAVIVLARLATTSRTAIAAGRAMYANPSPDRIAPGAG